MGNPVLLYPIYVSQSFDFSGGPYYACAVTGYFSHLVLDRKIILIYNYLITYTIVYESKNHLAVFFLQILGLVTPFYVIYDLYS